MYLPSGLIWFYICMLIIVYSSENPKQEIKIIPERQSINSDLTSLMVLLLNASRTPVEVQCNFSCDPLEITEETTSTLTTEIPIETSTKNADIYFERPVESNINQKELNSTEVNENKNLNKTKREVKSNRNELQSSDDNEGAILIMGAGGTEDEELIETLKETLETKDVTRPDGSKYTVNLQTGEDNIETFSPKDSKCSETSWQLEPRSFKLTAVTFQTLTLSRIKFPAMASIQKLHVICKAVDEPELEAYTEILSTFQPSPFHNETALPIIERTIPAPCPCDLTVNNCDIDCCCDKDCHIEGCYEELVKPLLRKYRCDHSVSIAFPFLCIDYYNSPYLGMYYPKKADIIRNITLLSELKLKHKRFSYDGQRSNLIDYLAAEPIVYSDGRLVLPAELYSGKCMQMSPVRFLIDSSASCTTRMVKENCSKKSIFSSDMYVQNCHSQSCKTFDKTDQVNIISINVTYKCTDSVYMDSSYSAGDEVLTNLSLCEFKEPHYNDTTDICTNVVFNVHYHLFWNSSVIQSLNATIILGNVQLQPKNVDRNGQKGFRNSSVSLEAKVTQHFSATFEHFKITNHTNITRSSGNPGYQFGKPVLLINGAPVTFQHPGEDNFCTAEPSSGALLLFGESIQVSCEMPFYQAENFTDLNQTLSNRHLKLFPMEVSSLGNPHNRKIPVSVLRNETKESHELPTIMNVEVLYTSICQSLSASYQLLGISVRYDSAPDLPCLSNFDSSCKTADDLDSLVITTNVRFIPAVIELRKPIKRYWLLMKEEDICWSQLFYPFSHYSEYGEISFFVSQCCIILILLGVSLIYLTKGVW